MVVLQSGHSFLLHSILKNYDLLSVELLKHAFLAKEVQTILDELRLHGDAHAKCALKSLDDPTHISDLLTRNASGDSPHLSVHDKVYAVVDHIV